MPCLSLSYHEGDGVVFDPLKISRRGEQLLYPTETTIISFLRQAIDLEAKIARLIPIGYTYEPLRSSG